MKAILGGWGLIASLILSALLLSGAPQDQFHCYLGVLHAHTVLSPDFEPKQSSQSIKALIQAGGNAAWDMENGPIMAWKRAADKAKIDFLALTDHLHGTEGAEPCAHEMPTNGYLFLVQCADRINNDPAYRGRFLAIPGMEWDTISAGNHINIFFAKAAVPNTIGNGKFDRLLQDYLKNPAAEGSNPYLLVQMNHPNQNGGSLARNYGRTHYPAGMEGDRAFVRDFGDVYAGIEHINNSTSGNENDKELNAHRDGDDLERFYKRYLNLGFRLAPIGDHDNHRPNWGRHTAARTGVWAKDLTKESFVEAYRARRVFATEDDELEVAFRCQGKWMGETVHVGSAQRITCDIRIDQRPDALTGQRQNEGPYDFWIFADMDGPGGLEAKAVKFELANAIVSKGSANQGIPVSISLTVKPGAYLYLQVKETRDQDGGTNADAWTAPIWFK